jgi:cell wall-associated NlpC family hydrolase
MQRAVQALTKRLLPGKAGQAAEMAVGAKLAIAALPAILIVVLMLATVAGVIGAVAGSSSAASAGSCGAGVPLNGPPKELIPIYEAASNAAGLNPDGPAMLAAINRVETDFGKDLGPSSAGAIGWMQFEPSTWAEYGEGGNPDDPHDAIFAAARLLKADGAPGNWYQAIFAYNHAAWYVEEVEKYAREYAAEVPENLSVGSAKVPEREAETKGGPEGAAAPTEETAALAGACGAEGGETATVPGEAAKILPSGLAAAPVGAPEQVKQMIAAGNQIAMLPYVWGGHHALGSPTDGYDCSSAVSYLMEAAGLLPSGSAGFKNNDFFTSFVAANFVSGGSIATLEPGPGKWVTVYSSGEHVFMEVAGIRFDDSADYLRNGKGPHGTNVSMWQPTMTDTAGFTPSHPRSL